MKRSIMCVVAMLLSLCMLIPAEVITADAKDKFYSSATTAVIKSHIEKDAELNTYATVQGSCTDGKYAYFAVNNGGTTLLKYDVNSWELVKKSSSIYLGHANDMTYNSDENVIVVANNAPEYNTVTFVDPDTLTVIGSKKIKQKIYSISYNSDYNRYVVGISGGYNFAVLNSKFKLIKKYKGYESGYLRQGADCDNDYLYFVQSGGGGNLIVIYNWSGELVDTVSVSKALEIENIFHVGNVIYITLHYYGNFVYRIGISDETAIKFKVHFNANGGDGKMKDISITYSKPKNLPECKFEKDGYFFGGWIMKRDSYKKYYGKKTPYSKSEWLKEKDVYEYTLYEDSKKISKTTNVGNVTATAFWIAENYRIYYDANGGSGTLPPEDVGYDETYKLSKSNMTKNGYLFAGWTAKRNIDNKVYGYAKNKDKPKWLREKDVHTPYIFEDEQEVSKLTYDKGVTFSAYWKLAFNYSKDGKTLTEYIGIDEDVTFPVRKKKVETIGENAFAHTDTMHSVTIPQTVTTIEDFAFYDCPALTQVCFEKTLPQDVSNTAFLNNNLISCYILDGKKKTFIGLCPCSLSYNALLQQYNISQ